MINVKMNSRIKTIRNDVIEKDLQSVLRPLNLMQSLFLCAKYSIRDNIITCNTSVYNFSRVLCTVIYRCFCLHFLIGMIKFLHNKFWGAHSFLYCLCFTVDFFMYLVGDLMNCFSNIMQSDHNILLVLKIQHVLNVLQINKKDNELRNLIIYNWTYVIILNILSIGFVICYCFTMLKYFVSFFEITTAYASIAFDINIVYALALLKLTKYMLYVWIAQVQKSTNRLEFETAEYWDKMLEVYLHILDIYLIIEKTFRHMVSLFLTSFSPRRQSPSAFHFCPFEF